MRVLGSPGGMHSLVENECEEALDAVCTEEARLGEGVMFEFTPPEWAENPFGELDNGPFEPEDDSDSSIEELPPSPPPRDGSLEEEAQDRKGELRGENSPKFVPFDQVADYDYIDLAAAEEQPDPVIEYEYIDLAAEENKDERRGAVWSSIKGPVYRPRQRPKPRQKPRLTQMSRPGAGTGGIIRKPTRQNIAQILKTQGVENIKLVDKVTPGAQKINIKYQGGSETLQTSTGVRKPYRPLWI